MVDLEKERMAFEDIFITIKESAFSELKTSAPVEMVSMLLEQMKPLFNVVYDEGIKSKQAEITALKQKVQSGKFVLVPKEPTKKMILVGHACWLPEDVYKAMIEASQQPTNPIDSFIASGGFDKAMGGKNGQKNDQIHIDSYFR